MTIFTLGVSSVPLNARTRKGDKFLTQARAAEIRHEWDQALTLAESALSEDPSDPAYQLATRRMRFESAGFHVHEGQRLRNDGQLPQALAQFQKAYAIDPALDVAEQEIRRTRAMIEREKRKADPGQATSQPGPDQKDEKTLTPGEAARRDTDDKIQSMLPVPELRPLNATPISLRMINQKPRVLFETVGKVAGVNVLFDPEYDTAGVNRSFSVDFNGSTIEQALDYLGLVTKSFWKPVSPNTIFVTVDNPTKRREFTEQVVKVFYLTNVTTSQELQEIITTLRTVTDIQKVFQYASQNAIIVRADADQMALAEMILSDLDKPKSEVMVDVMVLEVNSTHMRNLAAAFGTQGIQSNIIFTPRQSLQTLASSLNTTTSTTNTNGNTGSGNGSGNLNNNGNTGFQNTTTTSTTTSAPIPIPNIKHITSSDYSITNVPGGLLEAVLNDTGTRVLQAPQIRAVDNAKVSLKIGDKVPTASGSFQPGVGGVGINPLVNTQFTFLDVGVNIEITPKVHDNNEISLHLDLDVSQVKSRIDIGGVSQPVIGQRKAMLDIRMREGEINVLGGLIQQQDTKTVSGIPGLGNIPILRRLFTSEQIEKDRTELLITLIPHIIRGPDVSELNLKGVASGNATTIKLNYAPRSRAAAATAERPGNPGPVIPPSTTAPPPAAPQPPATAPPVVVNPGAPPEAAAPANPPIGNVVATFSPSQIDTQLSSAISVSLSVLNVTDLAAIQAQLRFDPKIIRLNNVVSGDVLQRSGPPLVPSKNILNDSGEATVSLTRAPDAGGVTGGGSLLTFVFQAVGRGTTTVQVGQLTLRSSAGQPIATTTPALIVNVK